MGPCDLKQTLCFVTFLFFTCGLATGHPAGGLSMELTAVIIVLAVVLLVAIVVAVVVVLCVRKRRQMLAGDA